MTPKNPSWVYGPNNLSIHVVSGDIKKLTQKTYSGGDLDTPWKNHYGPISSIGPKKCGSFFPHSVRPWGVLITIEWDFGPSSNIVAATANLKIIKIRPFTPQKLKLGPHSPMGPPRTKTNIVHKLSRKVDPNHAWPGPICNFTSFILWWKFCDIVS